MAKRRAAGFSLVGRSGHPDFLDLPWHEPLASWTSPRLVEVARGISRHTVRFVAYDEQVYALKEIDQRLADREYGLLRRLRDAQLPVVEAVGVVSGRTDGDGEPLDAVLLTRHLEFSLPYRYLFTGRSVPDPRARLVDALAVLLVRLHLEGFFWGDCSLSNALYRRDAGALSAYLVDAETGELHPRLSDGQRSHDLEIARENLGGEVLDLAASGRAGDVDPSAVSDELEGRYESLWTELTAQEELGPGERYRVDARLARLNQLGFDVEEFSLVSSEGGDHLRLQPLVVELGHHARTLKRRTGLAVQENQARRLLNDIAAYRAWMERDTAAPVPEAVADAAWLTTVFQPITAALPDDQQGKLQPAELFHEVLAHRDGLSAGAGHDIGNWEALASYVEEVLRAVPPERAVLPVPDEA